MINNTNSKKQTRSGSYIKVIAAGLLLLALHTGAYAQRSCATMDHYQQRLQQDPSLAERMANEEAQIQKWMEEHPVTIAPVPLKWPELPGFTPTGNETTDRKNYATAKENFSREHPQQIPATDASTEAELKAARKSKNDQSFTTIPQ